MAMQFWLRDTRTVHDAHGRQAWKDVKTTAERIYHSETQSSQKMCRQWSEIGTCIFSWHMAQRSPAATTCINSMTCEYIENFVDFGLQWNSYIVLLQVKSQNTQE